MNVLYCVFPYIKMLNYVIIYKYCTISINDTYMIDI
jgi:hypothetical protein